MEFLNWEMHLRLVMGLLLIFNAPKCFGDTDPRDVFAINALFAALGFPPLLGWLPLGGDPCGNAWQGVQCVNSNITGIVLNGANLGGELGANLDFFASVITINLNNNQIGGSIPSNLPPTMKNFFLSANKFSGSIPSTVSSLTQLSDLSFNDNLLTGEIPDAFQQLTGLINLDLSGNKLSGQLPPSFGNLLSLNTMHLENNQLSGKLDVLQDLPLIELDIENNLFSGPIPVKLLNIPDFRKAGNPFNTTVIPSPQASPPASPPPSSSSLPPSSQQASGSRPNGPSASEVPDLPRERKFLTTKRIILFSVVGFFIILVLAVGLWLFMSRCCEGKQGGNKISKNPDLVANLGPRERPSVNKSMLQPNYQYDHVPRDAVMKPRDGNEKYHNLMGLSSNSQAEHKVDVNRIVANSRHGGDHKRGIDVNVTASLPPPHLPSLLPVGKVIVNPTASTELPPKGHNIRNMNCSNSVRSFTVALLQQYTNSFSQENLIGGGLLSSVYRAELPDGKLLAVKNLESEISWQQSDDEFLKLVSSISKLKNVNIVELLGYCVEHGQRLLIYEYCRNGTLYDALHLDDGVHTKISWNVRTSIALGAARALEYLHEVCQPPTVHWNFKSANILLDDKLAARVSDCGLAPLLSSSPKSRLSGHLLSAYGYAAPGFELGSYTHQSDIYNFGVVMLELLTGRKSYDRSRPRGEQFLARWAIPQLHDIDALSRMVDPTLNGAYPSKSLSRFADIISLCVQPEPEFRPPMSEIVQSLLHMIERER